MNAREVLMEIQEEELKQSKDYEENINNNDVIVNYYYTDQ